MSVLSDAMKAIKDAVDDVTTVNVRTYTGSVQHILDVQKPNDDEKSKSFDEILVAADLSAHVNLQFLTVLDLDGDALLFRASDTTDASEKAEMAHQSAVLSGIESRAAIIDLFKGLAGDLVGAT